MAVPNRPPPHPLEATIRKLERSSGALATQSVARMDETLPWFRSLPADQRSWITLVAQAGVAALTEWLRRPGDDPLETTGLVFGAAPRYLARAVTLQQVVAMVKVTVEVVEEQVPWIAAPGEEQALKEAVLVFSREVAFAAAQVYARVAETRGAWDARLQALLVDTLLRGSDENADLLNSRAAALGWSEITPVAVAIGATPGATDADEVLDSVTRAGRGAGIEVLAGVHGGRLVMVIGGADDVTKAAGALLAEFGDGPVVVGHPVADLGGAPASARAALAGIRAVAAWPGAPRPVSAADLLPERVLCGDEDARRQLATAYAELDEAGGGLIDTLAAYLDTGGALEAASRVLFVHSNTVRYRLRRIGEVCGFSPTVPRDAFSLRLALALGRLDDADL
ncbi:PucR family transcriptional regulator [Fodinicola acaciae]|uniref:PucR family transcriptional regulator n=1 Tax=Fodinicola acaciae TaxID=2681555 RepID=UPI0013D17218|nr:helix-turn-helix domain-containing protein [Fodinicola acaciae]